MATLWQDVEDFWIPPGHQVSRRSIDDGLTALEFYRDYVSPSVPVILTHGMSDWPALSRWSDTSVFLDLCGPSQVSVNWTPEGYGDHVYEHHNTSYFVVPETRSMTMSDFWLALDRVDLDENSSSGVPYVSEQNDNLRHELPNLCTDFPSRGLALGLEAFGNEPEAVNLWIGDQLSISTLHKDHYENLYCVITGQKHFSLFPPAAASFLPEHRGYPMATYDSGRHPESQILNMRHCREPRWKIRLDESGMTTNWIPFDYPVQYPRGESSPFHGIPRSVQPIECHVNPGEILYLPSLWYHRVTQTCRTIAINYWHDMAYDCKYVYYNYLSSSTTANNISAKV